MNTGVACSSLWWSRKDLEETGLEAFEVLYNDPLHFVFNYTQYL